MESRPKTQTEDALCRAALAEKIPDGPIRPWDWLAWYQLRDLYRDYRAGKISTEQGNNMKRSIFKYRNEQIFRDTENTKASSNLARFWVKISDAARTYCKDPTIDHADKFVEAVYGASRLKPEDRPGQKDQGDISSEA